LNALQQQEITNKPLQSSWSQLPVPFGRLAMLLAAGSAAEANSSFSSTVGGVSKQQTLERHHGATFFGCVNSQCQLSENNNCFRTWELESAAAAAAVLLFIEGQSVDPGTTSRPAPFVCGRPSNLIPQP
jgi:hypothetical protein